MKELQKKVLNAVAKIGLKTAEKACGNASFRASAQRAGNTETGKK